MIDCLFINPPFNRWGVDYQKDASLARFQMDAINPGIISLYSYLTDQGLTAQILDFYRNHDFNDVKRKIKEAISEFSPLVVAISNSSAYDYIDTLELINWFSEVFPKVVVVVGGQHAGMLTRIVFNECQPLKFLLQGEGEYALYEFLLAIKNGKTSHLCTANLWERIDGGEVLPPDRIARPFDISEGSVIDLSVYPQATTFTPFVEESRACPYSCDFCNNASFYRSRVRVKSTEKFEKDLANAVELFGTTPMYAILTSDLHYPTAKEKAQIIQKYGILWSSQMDCLHDWSPLIPIFKASGMKLMNLGLESGSPKILRLMNKTKNTDVYLENCRNILKACHENGVLTRVNIMIYPGETKETLAETVAFLESVSQWLQGVVACATVAYPGSALTNNFEFFKREYGATLVDSPLCRKTHHNPIHPSAEISFDDATQIALDIEERFSPTRILSQKHNYKKYEGELF